MANAKHDGNQVPTLIGVSSVDSVTPTLVAVNPANGRLLVDLAGGGSGTVTSVSVVSANGFAGTVATATTTPAITISTTVTGILKGDGTAISAATAGTDYVTSGSTNTFTNKTYDTAGAGNAFSINSVAVTANSGTGAVARAVSPAFTTPSLGVATATSVTASGILATGTGAGTNGSITFTGSTSGTTILQTNVTASGTLTLPAATDTLIGKATTDTLTNKTFNTAGAGNSFSINGTAITAVNGTGAVSLTTSPAFVTPSLGVATATSINGNIFTTGSSTYTGTAAQTYTFPTTTATIARTDAAQTFTGTQTYTNAVVYTNDAITASGNAATVPITARVHTVTNNSAATLTITLTTGAADGQLQLIRVLDFSAVTQTITWVNTENSTVSVPTTSNGSTTLPLTVGFQYNNATSKWRCIASA